MKTTLKLCAIATFIAQSLSAWHYYNPGNYGGSSDGDNFQYSFGEDDDYPKPAGMQQMPEQPIEQMPEQQQPQAPLLTQTERPAIQQPPKGMPIISGTKRSLEQTYPNLIVMFTKDACPFCQYLKPIIEQVEMQFGKNIKFLYVDVARNPQYASQYGFSTVPQIMYFKGGRRLETHGSGDKTITAAQVAEKIRRHFQMR